MMSMLCFKSWQCCSLIEVAVVVQKKNRMKHIIRTVYSGTLIKMLCQNIIKTLTNSSVVCRTYGPHSCFSVKNMEKCLQSFTQIEATLTSTFFLSLSTNLK